MIRFSVFEAQGFSFLPFEEICKADYQRDRLGENIDRRKNKEYYRQDRQRHVDGDNKGPDKEGKANRLSDEGESCHSENKQQIYP